jgi:hypothetical protein
MDGKETRLGEGVGEATRSHSLHSGGAGKWFLVSGPQLSSLANHANKYQLLYSMAVLCTLVDLWM